MPRLSYQYSDRPGLDSAQLHLRQRRSQQQLQQQLQQQQQQQLLKVAALRMNLGEWPSYRLR